VDWQKKIENDFMQKNAIDTNEYAKNIRALIKP
jgi:hypothetical protein